MSRVTDVETAKAEARFKTQQALPRTPTTGQQAVEAERAAAAAKTEKLRALRLAKERSDQIAADIRKSRRQR